MTSPLKRKPPQKLTEDNQNYKELYLECKKNVANFMHQVDQEITNILKIHQAEKKKLKQEIQTLKTSIKQKDQSFALDRIPTAQSFLLNKTHSNTRSKSQSTVSKQTVEQFPLNILNFELNSNKIDKKLESGGSATLKKKLSSHSSKKSLKENTLISGNSLTEEDLKQMPLKLINNVPSRNKRFREKKSVIAVEDSENLKDFLKGMRGKLYSTNSQFLKEKEQENAPIVKVISPEMFNTKRSRI